MDRLILPTHINITKAAISVFHSEADRPLSICGRPRLGKGIFGIIIARSRMLPSVRPLMRQRTAAGLYGSSRVKIQITKSVLEALWKALFLPTPSRRLLRHTLLPIALRLCRPDVPTSLGPELDTRRL